MAGRQVRARAAFALEGLGAVCTRASTYHEVVSYLTPQPSPGEPVRQLRFQRPRGATTVVLARHGESAPALADRPFDLVDGQGDPPLSQEGRVQALRLAARLSDGFAGELPGAIYVTNLRRTSQTAKPLAQALGLSPRIERDLREVHLGQWEGGLYRIRVAQGHPLVAKLMSEQRWDLIPGAEPEEDFESRLTHAIVRIAKDHPDSTVVVFTHGGVIAKLMSLATGARPFAFLGAANASISALVVDEGSWTVLCYNDTAHLEGL